MPASLIGFAFTEAALENLTRIPVHVLLMIAIELKRRTG